MKFIKNNLGFVIAATVILVGLLYSYIVEENAMFLAPTFNKVIAGALTTVAIVYAYLFSKDNALFKDEKDDNRYFFKNLAVIVILIVAAMLTIAVFHSGPLGTTTNPIK
jgi:hypothetical protein